MRKYDVAYVPNGPKHEYPVVALQDMSFDEIVDKYIRTCAKAMGKVAECSKCKNPCAEGKRAIQLLANNVYNDPPIPLYGGKTMIEMAREENLRRRQQKEQKEKEEMKETRKRFDAPDDWWEQSLASGDQTKWLMENLGISKTQAKKKIYSYRYRHDLTNKHEKREEENEVRVENGPVVRIEKKTPEPSSIESKMERLLQLQEEQKVIMQKHMKLYEEAKAKYEEIKRKTDVLCEAFDILNDE